MGTRRRWRRALEAVADATGNPTGCPSASSATPRAVGGIYLFKNNTDSPGNMIVQRDIEKVLRGDEFSCIGVVGVELARLGVRARRAEEALQGRHASRKPPC
jgi:hypothetical protein